MIQLKCLSSSLQVQTMGISKKSFKRQVQNKNLTNRYEEASGQVDDQGGEEEAVRHADQGLQDKNVEGIDPAAKRRLIRTLFCWKRKTLDSRSKVEPLNQFKAAKLFLSLHELQSLHPSFGSDEERFASGALFLESSFLDAPKRANCGAVSGRECSLSSPSKLRRTIELNAKTTHLP